jgi:hypothetical protein
MSAPKQPEARVQNPDACVEKIVLRNDRIFAVFVAVGILTVALILTIMILRWDF